MTRAEAVPCRNATQYEIDRDLHITWDDESHCTVCRHLLDKFNTTRKNAEREEKLEAIFEAKYNTGRCMKCDDTGWMTLPDTHPSVYGLPCPDCEMEPQPA